MVPLLIILLITYLIGSIPFGLLLTKMSGIGDIRTIGSGNIGATNVLRTGKKGLAALTLALDSLKGAAAVLFVVCLEWGFKGQTIWIIPAQFLILIEHYTGDPYNSILFDLLRVSPETIRLLGGFAAILGHCFPVWLKFKGGKGVATSLGVLLAAVPEAGLWACGTWLLIALSFRISSLAALIAMAVAPLITFFIYGPVACVVNIFITALIYIRHKDNIKRLLKGEEPKIGKKT